MKCPPPSPAILWFVNVVKENQDRKKDIFKWAIMIRFTFFLRISFNALFFIVSSQEVQFMVDSSDFLGFPKLLKNQNLTYYENYRLPVKSFPNKVDSKFA